MKEEYKSVKWLKIHFPKGSYVTIRWGSGNLRTISRVKDYVYDNEYPNCAQVLIYYGVNSVNELKFNTEFGVGDNRIRFATKKEIEFLNKKLMESGKRNGGLRFLH